MKKIISLFKRDYEGTRLVYDEVVEGAEWVINGEGYATRKYDGTCCMISNGKLFKRYTLKRGRTQPPEFIPATSFDELTGKQEGWMPVTDSGEDKWHRKAFESNPCLPDGTYELVGPKSQGNPEKYDDHVLIPHGDDIIEDVPRTYEGLKEWFKGKDIEGIVWYHSSGDMVKIKKKDFGMKRGE